jgi:hypothetical protein
MFGQAQLPTHCQIVQLNLGSKTSCEPFRTGIVLIYGIVLNNGLPKFQADYSYVLLRCTHWSLFFPSVLFCVFCLSCCVFLFFIISLCFCLFLSSSMAESSHCFWICSRNLLHRLVFSLAFTLCRELMKSVGKL